MALETGHWNWNWYYKRHCFQYHQAYRPRTLQGGDLGWEEPNHKVTWHLDIVVTWQTKNAISPLSQGLWTANRAGWRLRMRDPHPKVTWHINHVATWQIRLYISHITRHQTYGPQTLQVGDLGHVTNQKYYIFTFSRRKAFKFSRVVTRMRRLHPTCHVKLWSRHHVTTIQ